MKRRIFIKNTSFTAFSVAALGSIHWNGKSFAGDSVTTTDILGPYYRPGSPMRSNLIPSGSSGEVLYLSGTVFQKDGRTPMPDVLLEAWQCDEHEHYDNISDDYVFRGAVKTDSNGSYTFKTIVPVPYKATENSWRPAHIHLRVSSVNHQDLITQIYFKGDPYLTKDSSSSLPEAVNRILEITKNSKGEKVVKFDLVLDKAYPLNEEGYNKICGLYNLGKDGMAEFYREDDLLFVKHNGHLVEALVYKGNNSFEGGVGYIKAKFELQTNGETKVVMQRNDFDDFSKVKTLEGVKFLKYSK